MKITQTLDSTQPQCNGIARSIKEANNIFILGKGAGEAIAKEGAMRFKETAKVHAEGYSAGEFKHGPLALADETTPFIFVINDDEYFQDMIYALS